MTDPGDRQVLDGEGSPADGGIPEDVKLSYAAALYHFARVGGVNAEEERVVEEIARVRGIDGATLSLARKVPLDRGRLVGILDRMDGVFLVRDVLRVAHADGMFEEGEQRVVARLADASGLSKARLAWVHSWVERELAMRAEWDDIVSSGPSDRGAGG